jgi:hypothetical protein
MVANRHISFRHEIRKRGCLSGCVAAFFGLPHGILQDRVGHRTYGFPVRHRLMRNPLIKICSAWFALACITAAVSVPIERNGYFFTLDVGPDYTGKHQGIETKTLRQTGGLIRKGQKTESTTQP